MRHIGPYRQVGATWGKLMAWAAPRGLVGQTTMALGVAHDDPEVTPPDKVRYDACIVVDNSFVPEGEVGAQIIGGGEYAITTHRGPYERVARTAARVCGEWLPASGREPRSAAILAHHRNFPPDTAPEDLLTDIYLPLE
jgi:AraC family transcriptional regulator